MLLLVQHTDLRLVVSEETQPSVLTTLLTLVTENQCVPSTNDALGSFEVLVYDSTGGGEACPPGTLTAASTVYPAPTG